MIPFAETRRAIGWTLRTFFASIGLVFVVVTLTPLTAIWAGRLASPWNDDSGDLLIILSGNAIDNGVAGINSYWRCFYGAQAWRLGGFSRVLITGDSVVEPMKKLLAGMGVPEAVIQVEAQSGSTRESAIHSLPLLLHIPGKKVLLTSDYHMFRSRRVFGKLGIATGVWPVPDITRRGAQWNSRWPAFLDLVDESFKIGYYRLRGWI